MKVAARDRWLYALIGIGLLLRVGLALWAHGSAVMLGDERVYAEGALSLLETGEIQTDGFVRPPLYFVFLAGIRLLPGDWALTARIVQCLLGVAAAIPVYRTTRRIAGVRAARLAAGFLLLDPTLIAFCHLLWPETLFLLFAAIVFDGVGRLTPEDGRRALGLGAVTGAAMLLKPVFGLFTLLLTAWWIRRFGLRPALRLAVQFGLAAALVTSPWVVLNQLRFGPAIVFENQGPYNLWIGNDPAPAVSIVRRWRAMPDPVTRSRVAMEKGLAAIQEDVPGFLERSAVRALNLWGLEFFVVRNLIMGAYRNVDKLEFLAIFWIIQAGYAVLLVCFAIGIVRSGRSPPMDLLLIYAAVFTVLVSAMVGTTRFRIPFAFALSVGAGIGLDRLLAGGLTRSARLAAAVALLVLGLSASRPLFREIMAAEYEKPRALYTEARSFFRY